jgi:hypothetical protein
MVAFGIGRKATRQLSVSSRGVSEKVARSGRIEESLRLTAKINKHDEDDATNNPRSINVAIASTTTTTNGKEAAKTVEQEWLRGVENWRQAVACRQWLQGRVHVRTPRWPTLINDMSLATRRAYRHS